MQFGDAADYKSALQPSKPITATMTSTATKTINLGSIDQIAPGQGRCYIAAGKRVAVFRLRDGTVRAIQNVCPHKAGPLAEGITGDGKVMCPLHGHKFDLTTGEGSEKGERVKVYQVRMENGQVVLEL